MMARIVAITIDSMGIDPPQGEQLVHAVQHHRHKEHLEHGLPRLPRPAPPRLRRPRDHSPELRRPTLSRIPQSVAKGEKAGDGRLQEQAHRQRSGQSTRQVADEAGQNLFHGVFGA
jgi:hypothetical protein